MRFSRIIGTGSYVPERVMTNADVEKIVDTTDQWIQDRTGIKQRHVTEDGQTTTDLAFEAARNAMSAAEINPKDIDLIIFGTTTPDVVFPSSASLLQHRLGMRDVGSMDVNAACSGFIYALSVADQYIRAGTVDRVLVLGAETITRLIDWEDRQTCVLFGDGAGGVVLEASEEPGILSTHIHADGQYAGLLNTDVGISAGFRMEETNGGLTIQMKGNEVFKVAVRTLSRIVDETLEANGLDRSDVDWLVPHQANLRIISAIGKKLGLPEDRVIVTVDRHGNTSAASVPLALDSAVRSGKIKRGETVLLEAFGGGFTWGSAVLKY